LCWTPFTQMLPAVQRSPRTAPEWLSAHASPSKLDLASQVPPGHGGLAVFIRRIAARARAKSRRWGGPSASVPGSRFPMSCVGKLTRAVLDQVAALVESLAHTSRHRDERLRDQADNQPRARTPAARPLARNELNPVPSGGGDAFGLINAVSAHVSLPRDERSSVLAGRAVIATVAATRPHATARPWTPGASEPLRRERAGRPRTVADT